MYTIYILTLVIGLSYFLLKERQHDWLTISFISATAYYYPAVFGFGTNRIEIVAVPNAIYGFLSLLLFSLLCSAILIDAQKFYTLRFIPFGYYVNYKRLVTASAWTFLIIGCFGLALEIGHAGDALLSPDKKIIAKASTRWSLVWTNSHFFSLILGLVNRRKIIVAFSFASLAFSVFLGFRVFFVLALVAVFAIYLFTQGKIRLAWHSWRFNLASVFAVIFVLFYKPVYKLIKTGDWSGAASKLTDPTVIYATLTRNEASSRVWMLSKTYTDGLKIDPIPHYSSVLSSSFANPLTDKNVAYSFGDVAKKTMAPNLEWGIASNIFSEILATFSYSGLLVSAIVFSGVSYLISGLVRSFGLTAMAYSSLFMVYISFYIHRNDLYRLISFLGKQNLILLIAGTIIAIILVFTITMLQQISRE